MLNWSDLYYEEEQPINYLTDRIQPFVLFKMPDSWVRDESGSVLVEGRWIEFSLGVFLLSSPVKKEVGQVIYRDVEGFDGMIILQEDKLEDRTLFKKGSSYTDNIISILEGAGIIRYNLERSSKTLPNDIEYEPGTEKAKPINDFLEAINFTQMYVDEYDYYSAVPYISPSLREADYEYFDDEISITENGMEEELEIRSVPNKWVAVYSSADSESNVFLKATYINSNPESPTSTVSRGFNIVDVRQVEDIADQAALNDYVKKIAFEASQIYGKVKFSTAIMPFHGYMDVLQVRNSTLGIDDKYSETSWKISLQAGSRMEHELRKVVNV